MSEAQLKSLVLIPKFTGGLSMLGSSLVCWDILKDRKTKLRKVYHRLLFVMSFMDIFLSFSLFLSTWPIPKDTPFAPWLAAGNDATCTAQGFAQVFFMPALFYNAYLSIYYVLVIVYGWPERRMIPLEGAAHAFSFVFACVTAFTALALDMYGSNFLVWCFITGSWNLQLAINIAWQWAAWVVVFVMMGFLCWKIGKQFRTQEKYGEEAVRARIDRENTPQSNQPRQSWVQMSLKLKLEGVTKRMSASSHTQPRRRSTKEQTMRLITSQAALYSLSYLLTESSNIAVSIAYYTSSPVGNVPVWVLQYALITIPLQGFWNCLIYFRPRFLKWRDERRKKRMERRDHTTTVAASQTIHNRTCSGHGESWRDGDLGSAANRFGDLESAAVRFEKEGTQREPSEMFSGPLGPIEDVDEAILQSYDDEAELHSQLADQDDEASFYDHSNNAASFGCPPMVEPSENDNPDIQDEEEVGATFSSLESHDRASQRVEDESAEARWERERTHHRIDEEKLAAATDAITQGDLDLSDSFHWKSTHHTRRHESPVTESDTENALDKPSFEMTERSDSPGPQQTESTARSNAPENATTNGGAVARTDAAVEASESPAAELEEEKLHLATPALDPVDTLQLKPSEIRSNQLMVAPVGKAGSEDTEESAWPVEYVWSIEHDARCE